jgi:hypothetical protein
MTDLLGRDDLDEAKLVYHFVNAVSFLMWLRSRKVAFLVGDRR